MSAATTGVFGSADAADRYAAGRLAFHAIPLRRAKQVLRAGQLPRGLDVGCGTGLSAVALLDLAASVVGVDPSIHMIAKAAPHPHVAYELGRAEDLPFADASFDVASMSQTFHWTDGGRALRELRRVLRPAAPVIVYDNYFLGSAADAPAFEPWFREVFLSRFPTPSRGPNHAPAGDAGEAGFTVVHEESLMHAIAFTHEALIRFLLSMSNVIACTRSGEELAAQTHWLAAQSARFFVDRPSIQVLHRTPLWIYR